MGGCSMPPAADDSARFVGVEGKLLSEELESTPFGGAANGAVVFRGGVAECLEKNKSLDPSSSLPFGVSRLKNAAAL
jgi:hypothetical protein